jgi:hypothetical protein
MFSIGLWFGWGKISVGLPENIDFARYFIAIVGHCGVCVCAREEIEGPDGWVAGDARDNICVCDARATKTRSMWDRHVPHSSVLLEADYNNTRNICFQHMCYTNMDLGLMTREGLLI